MSAVAPANPIIRLRVPIDDMSEVTVWPGAPTIEQAVGMSPAMIRRLHPDDRLAIFKASKI